MLLSYYSLYHTWIFNASILLLKTKTPCCRQGDNHGVIPSTAVKATVLPDGEVCGSSLLIIVYDEIDNVNYILVPGDGFEPPCFLQTGFTVPRNQPLCQPGLW